MQHVDDGIARDRQDARRALPGIGAQVQAAAGRGDAGLELHHGRAGRDGRGRGRHIGDTGGHGARQPHELGHHVTNGAVIVGLAPGAAVFQHGERDRAQDGGAGTRGYAQVQAALHGVHEGRDAREGPGGRRNDRAGGRGRGRRRGGHGAAGDDHGAIGLYAVGVRHDDGGGAGRDGGHFAGAVHRADRGVAAGVGGRARNGRRFDVGQNDEFIPDIQRDAGYVQLDGGIAGDLHAAGGLYRGIDVKRDRHIGDTHGNRLNLARVVHGCNGNVVGFPGVRIACQTALFDRGGQLLRRVHAERDGRFIQSDGRRRIIRQRRQGEPDADQQRQKHRQGKQSFGKHGGVTPLHRGEFDYFNVTINKDNGEDPITLSKKYGSTLEELTPPEKAGYTFVKWL